MAGYEDLANKLKPFLADDKEFQEQLRHSVVLDVDTKDAQASFATIEKRIESLKKSVAEFGKGTEEALKASSALSKETGIAIAVIGEKYRQVGEQIKQTIAEITTNSERLNFAKSGGTGKKSGLVKGLEEEQTQLKKQLESRKKLQEEYKSEISNLQSTQSNSFIGKDAVSDQTTKSLSRTKAVVEGLRSEIALTQGTVSTLSAQIKQCGSDATSTAIAMSQIGKSNREAVRDIDKEYAKIQKDAESIWIAEKSVPDNGATKEETALIAEVIAKSKDYADVLEMLREARAKAFIATSGDQLAGGIDTAQTEEQKELYNQVILAMGQYMQAIDDLAVMKQHVSSDDAQSAIDGEENSLKRLVDVVNQYREATNQAALSEEQLHELFFTHGKDTSSATNYGKQDDPNGDAYAMYNRNLAREHGQKIVDQKKEEALDATKEDVQELEQQTSDFGRRLSEAVSNVDTSWIEELGASTLQLIHEYDELLKAKKKIESGKPLELLDDDEFNEYVNIVALMEKIAYLTQNKPKKRELPQLSSTEDKKGGVQKTGFESLEQLKAEIEKTKSELDTLRTKARNGDIANFDESLKNAKELEAKLKGLEKMRSTLEGKQQTPMTQNAADITSLDALNEKINEAKLRLRVLQQEAKNGNITNFSASIEETKRLEQEIKNLEKMRSSIAGKPTNAKTMPLPNAQSLEQVDEEIQRVQTRLESIRNHAAKGDIVDFNTSVIEAQQLEVYLKRLQQARKLMTGEQEEKSASGLLGTFVKLIKLKSQLASQRSELPRSLNTEESLAGIKETEKEIKRLQGVIAQFKQAPLLQAFAKSFSAIHSAVKVAVPAVANFVRNGIGLLKTGVQQAMSGLKNLASNGFHAVAKGANVLKSGFVSVQKRMHAITKKATPNMLKSLTSIKSMLMRRVKRTFISAIFNQAKEGLNELAKHSESFNKAMSGIKNSAKESAGNLAVTLGSMVETIAPALQTLLGWFNQLLVAINSVFALLQGKKSVTVAKQSTDDYAKSLKSASGSAKDLNHQLYGFDEITRQEDNKGSGSGKIGYAEQQVGDMYSDIANMLKAGKFREIGTLIGNQLTEITRKIDSWINGVRSKAKQWARNIAEILNGLIDTDLFASMGTTVGDGLNLVMDTLYTFLTSFDFATFGKKIADGLNHLFDAVEWDLLGNLLSERFNAIYVTIANFVQNAKWGEWGKNLATTVTNFFNNFNWDAKRQAIIGGINGVVELLNNFFTGVNWADIAGQFAKHINGIFSGIKWSGKDGISGMLSNGINSIIAIFATLVDPEKGINFGKIATDIGTGVGELFKNVNWATLAEAIGDGIGQLVTAFGNLLTSLDLPGIAVKLAEGVNAFFDPQKGGATFETAISAVSTGMNGVIDAFAKLLDPTEGINFAQISETIASSINGLVKQTDWATLIETLLTLHIDIQQAFWDVVAQIEWGEIGQKLADGINGLFKDADGNLDTSKFENLGKSIGEGVKGMIEGLDQFIGEIDLDAILEGIFAFIDSIPWTDIVVKLVETAADFLSKAVSALPRLVQGIIDLIGKIDWLDVAMAIVGGVAQVLVDAVNAVGGVLSTIWEAIFGSGEEEVEIPKILSDQVMNQLKEQMGEAGRELANTLNNALVDSLDDAGSDYEAAKQLFLNSASLIGLGFQDEMVKQLRDAGWTDDAIASLSSQIDAVYEACKEPSATIDSVKEAFRNNGIWITDGMAEAFIGEGSENIASALQLMALGVDKETIAALDISHLNENLTAYMDASGEKIEAIAGTLGANVGQKIGGTVPEFISKALEEGKEAVAATAEEVAEVADTSASQAQAGQNAKETGETVAENLADGETSKKDEVENSTSVITKTIDDKIKELPEKEQANAKKMMEMMLAGILEGDPLVQTAIQNSADEVVKKVTETLSGNKGREVVRNFLDGMRSEIDETFATKVYNNLVTLSGQIVSAMATRLSKSNGYTIMYNVFAGMNEAISNNGQPLVNNFAKVIQALVDTAREVLDEHSPSKVFNQIGSYVMEGMAHGIESTGSDAIGAVGDVAQSIINEAENGDGIKFQIGAMTDGMDVVTDKMERLAQVFSDIASTIAEMGGLEIPTVASGRVLPYRTQIDSAGSAEGAMFDENALESTLYSAITRALGTGSGDRDINITLSIDGRKLSDIVTKYQRQQNRAWSV